MQAGTHAYVTKSQKKRASRCIHQACVGSHSTILQVRRSAGDTHPSMPVCLTRLQLPRRDHDVTCLQNTRELAAAEDLAPSGKGRFQQAPRPLQTASALRVGRQAGPGSSSASCAAAGVCPATCCSGSAIWRACQQCLQVPGRRSHPVAVTCCQLLPAASCCQLPAVSPGIRG